MTRLVTGMIRDGHGDPLAQFPLEFTVMPSVSTLEATYPQRAIAVETEADGTFAVQLATGIRYRVELTGVVVRHGDATEYPPGSRFTIVVPEGEGSISLEAIRQLGNVAPPPDPTLLDVLTEALAVRLIPPGGQPGDALVKATDGDFAFTWGTANAHFSSEDD